MLFGLFGRRKATAVKEGADPGQPQLFAGASIFSPVPITNADTYQSILAPETDEAFQKARENSTAILQVIGLSGYRQTRLTLFDFTAPVAWYFSALLAGWLLIKLSLVMPALLPAPGRIFTSAHYIACVTLLLGFMRVAARNYSGRFSAILPRPFYMNKRGRRIYRRFGRAGWFFWYLTKPFWAVLALGACIAAIYGAVALGRAAWNTLPSTPEPATRPGRIFVRESPAGGFFRQFLKLFRTLIFLVGTLGVMFALPLAVTGNRWVRPFTAGLGLMILGVFLTLLEVSTGPEPAPEIILGD